MTAVSTERTSAMPAWVAGGVLAAVIAGMFGCGITVGMGIEHDRELAAWNFGTQIRKNEAGEPFAEHLQRHQLTPMDMRFSIVPRAEFDRLAGPGVAAFAYVNQRPCRVVVPDDWMIDYIPKTSAAIWDDSGLSNYAADIIAHELLHCQIGKWHPEP